MNPRIPHQKKLWCQNKCFHLNARPSYQILFESAVAITLHCQLCSACYTALQTKNSRRSASATIPITTKIRRFVFPQLPITASKVQWPLRFAFSYVQPVTQRYKRRTVLKSSMQSVQPPWKLRTIPVYKCTREATHRATANRHLGLSAKRNGTQRRIKIVHDACIVRTAVCQKAHLGTKQHRTVKKSSP